MVERLPDDGTLSPEDLKRLGLGGQGDLSRLHRWFEGLPAFGRALRPTWRGILGTILACWALVWVGTHLPWALHPLLPHAFPDPDPPFLESLRWILDSRVADPITHLVRPLSVPWSRLGGLSVLILALLAPVPLFRAAKGRIGMLRDAAITAAAGVGAILWILFQVGQPWGWSTFWAMAVPNAVLWLAGGAFATWILVRATRIGPTRVPFAEAARPLAMAGLLTVNAYILLVVPIANVQFLIEGGLNDAGSGRLEELARGVMAVTTWSTPILGGLLLFVPAIVVARGCGILAAVRCVGRILVRRPAAFVLAMAGLGVLGFLPVGAVLEAALESAGWTDRQPNVFPESVLNALSDGVQMGLFVYATVLAANALHDSLDSDGA